MKFIQKNIEGVSEEELDEYSVALGKLFRWLKLAIEVRIEDVKLRKKNKDRLRLQKKKAEEAEAARMEKRQQAHDEEAAKFKEQQEALKAEADAAKGDGEDGADGE